MGYKEYVDHMWNVIDFVTNALYVATVALSRKSKRIPLLYVQGITRLFLQVLQNTSIISSSLDEEPLGAHRIKKKGMGWSIAFLTLRVGSLLP